jgi:hypothetical protein
MIDGAATPAAPAVQRVRTEAGLSHGIDTTGMDATVERGRQGRACSGVIIGGISELHMKNWFHRRGGWSDDVVAFFYIFNSDVFPVELRIFRETQTRKNPPPKKS